MAVVDLLEVVEINDDQRDLAGLGAGGGDSGALSMKERRFTSGAVSGSVSARRLSSRSRSSLADFLERSARGALAADLQRRRGPELRRLVGDGQVGDVGQRRQLGRRRAARRRS